MKLNSNYNDYIRVQKAFKTFITALVEESVDENSVNDKKEVANFVDKFCTANGRRTMGNIWQWVYDYLTEITSRYELKCFEDGDSAYKGNVKITLNSNSLNALNQRGVDFYTKNDHSYVEIYDRHKGEVIITLDRR